MLNINTNVVFARFQFHFLIMSHNHFEPQDIRLRPQRDRKKGARSHDVSWQLLHELLLALLALLALLPPSLRYPLIPASAPPSPRSLLPLLSLPSIHCLLHLFHRRLRRATDDQLHENLVVRLRLPFSPSRLGLPSLRASSIYLCPRDMAHPHRRIRPCARRHERARPSIRVSARGDRVRIPYRED